MTNATSEWKGSLRTARAVAVEIGQRWGEDEVRNYDPEKNCFTFRKWNELGYSVKKGEKSIRSCTFIPGTETDSDGKEHDRSYPKTVHLFYYLQVNKRGQAETDDETQALPPVTPSEYLSWGNPKPQAEPAVVETSKPIAEPVKRAVGQAVFTDKNGTVLTYSNPREIAGYIKARCAELGIKFKRIGLGMSPGLKAALSV